MRASFVWNVPAGGAVRDENWAIANLASRSTPSGRIGR